MYMGLRECEWCLPICKEDELAWHNIIHTNNAAQTHTLSIRTLYVCVGKYESIYMWTTNAKRPIYAEKILIKQFTFDLHKHI